MAAIVKRVKLTESNRFALSATTSIFVILGLIAQPIYPHANPVNHIELHHHWSHAQDTDKDPHARSTTGLPMHVPQSGLTKNKHKNACVIVGFLRILYPV